MKLKQISKFMTFIFAIAWLMLLSGYGSYLIGTYVHESMHAENAIDIKAIEVNYDGSGVTRAAKFVNSDNDMHKWIYFNDNIVFSALMAITVICVLVIATYSYFTDT